jgi:hypothetical protein
LHCGSKSKREKLYFVLLPKQSPNSISTFYKPNRTELVKEKTTQFLKQIGGSGSLMDYCPFTEWENLCDDDSGTPSSPTEVFSFASAW